MKISCALIIDDSEGDQFLTKDLIQSEYPDAEVLQAYDGQEALEIIKQCNEDIDLIILDINMPRMDGHEFLKIYNEMSVQKKPPVVVMLSSSCHTEDKDKSMAYDFVVDYFVKALDKDDLFNLPDP